MARCPVQMHLSLLNWVIGLIQGILYTIVGFCIFQMFYGEEYYTNILSIIATISFSVEIFVLGLLTLKLVNWCKLNKSKILWMFILSSSSLAITGILMNFQINILFENSLSRVSDDMPGISPVSPGNSLIEFLQGSDFIFSLVSFTLMWITTAFLLYHYSKKVGNRKYWVIIAIPLVFYLSQFIFLSTKIFAVLINSNPFFYIIALNTVYSMSLPIGESCLQLHF